jgi:hypothetical protein
MSLRFIVSKSVVQNYSCNFVLLVDNKISPHSAVGFGVISLVKNQSSFPAVDNYFYHIVKWRRVL